MNREIDSLRGKLWSMLHCFNVAAICSLAIWHAYAFYLNKAVSHDARPHQLELLPTQQQSSGHKVMT